LSFLIRKERVLHHNARINYRRVPILQQLLDAGIESLKIARDGRLLRGRRHAEHRYQKRRNDRRTQASDSPEPSLLSPW